MELEEVNATDVVDAIRLGCEAMGRAFDADDPHGVAFFDAVAWPEPRLSFSDVHSEAHVPGRHLDALLAAEAFAGIPADPDVIARHRAALLFSFAGAVPLPLNRARIDGPLEHFCQHNVREGLHGLAALARWREDDEAAEVARRAVRFIRDVWAPPDCWSIPISPPDCATLTLVQGLGRAIGPLVKLWQATGDDAAFDLAHDVADAVIASDAVPADGAYRPEILAHHTHSTASTLSSLAQLADVDGDQAALARIHAFADNGLWRIRDEIGWAAESTAPDANPDKGEGNTSGDIVETLVILARNGYEGAAGDARRIVQAHLLPSQLRDVSWIPESAGTTDGTTNVAHRLRGAWGFAAPYGHDAVGLERIKFNLDVVGGVVGSLAAYVAADLPARDAPTIVEIELRHRTRTIPVRINGDRVEAMANPGARWPFFPPL
jgi:hypothetical protein